MEKIIIHTTGALPEHSQELHHGRMILQKNNDDEP